MSPCQIRDESQTSYDFESLSELQLTSNVYIKMRSTARPTAEMETSVPMQYFITSYFAASSCALRP